MGGPLEKDTCRDVILPALRAAGWADEQIRPEYPVKAKKIRAIGGVERDHGAGRVDYVLEIVPGLPVAVVEAKRAYREAREGLGQAIRYGEQLDVPVVYASNGAETIERDFAHGTERTPAAFRTPAELWSDYCSWLGVTADEARLLSRPFNRNKRSVSGDVVHLRWYQQVAVNRVLTAILRGDTRLLLLMATGTGKTFTAMQIVAKLRAYHRFIDEFGTYRVLYLADRDALVQQPIDKDFGTAFGTDPIARVSGGQDGKAKDIVFATYQAMSGATEESALLQTYRPDFFDLVIVDECHRGSADENSSWRRILEYFDTAVQLGLTATPKQDETVDTYRYFGEPLFAYSLRQGIEDGYLAPYRVRRVVLSPDAEGWEPDPDEVDIHGQPIEQGMYTTRDFERRVRLLARTRLACAYLVRRLRELPARMIVFCHDQEHAEEVRRTLVGLCPEWTRDDPEWVVRITSDEEEKKRLIKDLSNAERDSPLVATTTRLLATGIDIEDLRYVAIFRSVGSQVEFKQIVGRGTRLYPDKGKTSFELIDFVGASAHFADPDFDGFPTRIDTEVVEPGGGSGDGIDVQAPDADTEEHPEPWVHEPEPPFTVSDPAGTGSIPPGLDDGRDDRQVPRRPVVVERGDFEILAEALQVPDTSTGRLVLSDYAQYVSGQIKQLASSPAQLAALWSARDTREAALAALAAADIDVEALRGRDAASIDPLDILLNLAWNQPTRTRSERVRRVREEHHAHIERMSIAAQEVLTGLLQRYEEFGIDDVTSPEVLRLPPLADLGRRNEILQRLGGGEAWRATVTELQSWLYSTETAS